MYDSEFVLVSPNRNAEEDSSKTKRTVRHDYHDHSTDQPFISENNTTPIADVDSTDDEEVKKRRGPRGGVAIPFPEKLHLMLNSVESDGNSKIVSWQCHGRCFVVHKPKDFVATVMPKYFRQTKLTSFQRQLNLYGFSRLTSGKDRGGYYHELFLRGKPFLCKRMMRTRIKGTGIKAASSPQTEPDFYAMPPVKDFSESSCSLEEMMSACPNSNSSAVDKILIRAPSRGMVPQNIQSNASIIHVSVTPEGPAMVTPIHAPAKSPPEFPSEMNLSDSQPDIIVNFEGQQFHYLDPEYFFVSTTKIVQSDSVGLEDRRPPDDIVMV